MGSTVKNSRLNLLKMGTALIQPKALHQVRLQARSFQIRPGKIPGIMMYWVQNLIVNLGHLCWIVAYVEPQLEYGIS